MFETRIAAATSPTVSSEPPPGTNALEPSTVIRPSSVRIRRGTRRQHVAPGSQVPRLPQRVHRSSGSLESRLTKHQESGRVKHPDGGFPQVERLFAPHGEVS